MQTINSNHPRLSVLKQCQLLQINRSSYYYEGRGEAPDSISLMNEIRDIWERYPFFGYRRITAMLRRSDIHVNRKRVQRLMRVMGLQALYPKPRTTIRNHDHKIYPYLLKDVTIDRSDQVWCTDITYIKMNPGFVYLVAILDIHSRYVISWRLSISLEAAFCLEALDESLVQGKPDIFNTDQGCQFTSKAWIEKLLSHNIKVSMDGKGRCIDNIYIERLWRSVKYEEVYLKSYSSVREARESIAQYLEFYNHQRPHQSLNYRTPAEVYFESRPKTRPDGYVDNSSELTTSPQVQQTATFFNKSGEEISLKSAA